MLIEILPYPKYMFKKCIALQFSVAVLVAERFVFRLDLSEAPRMFSSSRVGQGVQ